jgi:M6 family metalloprotease-like protein
MSGGALRPVPLFVALACACTTGATGQDIEALSELRGIPLPEAYHRQVRANPDFYEFERALFNRVGGKLSARGPVAVDAARTAVAGQVRLPVVLALFADSPERPHVTREMVQTSLFTGPAERGTITEAYLEMSRGALEVNGDAFGWVRTGLTVSEIVGTESGFGPDARIGEYLVEALDLIDGSVDFALYDNDGPDGIPDSGDDDGYVDVITIEYLEVGASCGGPAIWPHRSRMSSRTGVPYETDDLGIDGNPIRIQDYITQGATDCTGAVVQDASVLTHEFGHALGLPDWYHWIDPSLGPYGRRWVLGCWALMAAGSWGCGPVADERDPFGPTHMIGYAKAWLGWLDYLEIGEVWNQEIILHPMETTGLPLRVQLDDAGGEFLIAEYRTQQGFDAPLPGAGVLMYKHDDNASIRPSPSSGDPYFLTMLERDGNGSLLKMASEGGSRGEIGDAWGVDGFGAKLNATTTPSLRLADGGHTPVMVHEVYVEGDQARLVISTGLEPRLVEPEPTLEVMQVRTFTLPVRIAGGRGPYSGVGTLQDGVSLTAVSDELLLVGSVRDPGPYVYEFAVRDSFGSESDPVHVTLTAPIEWVVEAADLLRGFLEAEGAPLTPGEIEYLDDSGNANGIYDVGDFRKWLRGTGH